MAVMLRKLIVSYWQDVYFLHFCTLIILFFFQYSNGIDNALSNFFSYFVKDVYGFALIVASSWGSEFSINLGCQMCQMT